VARRRNFCSRPLRRISGEWRKSWVLVRQNSASQREKDENVSAETAIGNQNPLNSGRTRSHRRDQRTDTRREIEFFNGIGRQPTVDISLT
jgi:hypothetical protein